MVNIRLKNIMCTLLLLLLLNINTKNDITKVNASELGASNQIIEKNNNFNLNFDDIEYPIYVEKLDYVELMNVDDINVFNRWISSFNINHNSKENILFVRNNLNKLILKAIKLNVIRDIFNSNKTRFSVDTHSLILTDEIEIFEYDGKFEVTNFYINYLDTLSYAVEAPDMDESLAGTHYYVYNENEISNGYYKNNYNSGAKYSISTRTRFEEHYTAAINIYKNNNNKSKAMEELGRALHYLQDVASTPHSCGLTSSFDLGGAAGTILFPTGHKYYEDWVKKNYNYNSIYKTTTANNVYDYVLNIDNPGKILNDIAEFSAQYENSIKNTSSAEADNPNSTRFGPVASACLPYAQQMTAALLNRFYQDVTNVNRNPQYIRDGAVYYIKNVESDKYIDVKSWSTDNNAVTHAYNFTGDTNQQFRAELQDDGSYRFTPMHAFDKKITYF